MRSTQTGRTFFALGTMNSISTFESGGDAAADEAMARVLQIHSRMSAFQLNSDICRLNAAAGIRPVSLHPDTAALLLLAKTCARITNGAFDITLRPLCELWSVGKRASFIPLPSQIKDGLMQKGIEDLKIDHSSSTAFLARPGMAVDLGGIAKGYAGDEIRRILLAHGIQNALINLGGNIVAMGESPKRRPWRVGVQNPLMPRGNSLVSLDIRDSSVVTSGVGERFFIKDKKRFHHILDPHIGMPAQSGLLSVTVSSPSGVLADALSTALFVLGPKEGLSLLKDDAEGFFSDAGIQALFLTEDLSIIKTPGLSFSPYVLKEVQ
jgi:thiamine biosynthesis lipoprotein